MAHFTVTVLLMLVIGLTIMLAMAGHYWLLWIMLAGALAQIGDQVFFKR